MIAFKSISEQEITGRGKVFVVENENIKDKNSLLGQHVLIDDKEYIVKGVESMMLLLDPPKQGTKIGLLVKPIEK